MQRSIIRLLDWCWPIGAFFAARWAGLEAGPAAARAASMVLGHFVSTAELLYAMTLVTLTSGPSASIVLAGILHKLRIGSRATIWMAIFLTFLSGAVTIVMAQLKVGRIPFEVSLSATVTFLIGFALAGSTLAGPNRYRLPKDKAHAVRRVNGGPWQADWMEEDRVWKDYSHSDGLILGEAYRPDLSPELAGKADLILWKPKGHLLTVSGSGGGKSVSVSIPNALTWRGSLVLHDPSSEVIEKVRRARKAMGRKVRVLSMSADTDGVDVLSWIDPRSDDLPDRVEEVVSWLDPADGKEDDKGFRGAGRAAVACVILFVLTSPTIPDDKRTLETVYQLVTAMDHAWLTAAALSPQLAGGAVARKAKAALAIAAAPETFGGVAMNAGALVGFLEGKSKSRLLSGNVPPERRFALQDVLAGDTDIFLCVDINTLKSQPQICRLIMGALISLYFQKVGNPQTLFLIDEMPLFGPLAKLETARDAGRKHGIILWGLCQSLGQLAKAWGEEGVRAWLDSSYVQQYFGVGDPQTAEMLSGMIGEYTAHTSSVTKTRGKNHSSGQSGQGRSTSDSLSEQGTAKALISKDQIRQMRVDQDGVPDEQIILIRNQPPIRAGMAKWYRRPELRALVEE